jgi:LytS/YehU family sensor histidine kinase
MAGYAKQVMLSDLRAIRAQMNPHFIFNSLNSINRYILKNEPEIASDYLGRFAKLMRLVLDHSNHERIALSMELEAMQLYLELEQLRFEHSFVYEIKIGDSIDTEKSLVQPLIFQPFLENAIWHGLMHKENGERRLYLNIHESEGKLVCEIIDNGVGREIKAVSKEGAKKKSYGINLGRDRLKFLDREAEIKIIDLKDEHGKAAGTQVNLIFKKVDNYTL